MGSAVYGSVDPADKVGQTLRAVNDRLAFEHEISREFAQRCRDGTNSADQSRPFWRRLLRGLPAPA